MHLIVLDTETSGLTPPVGVCECAFIEIDPATLNEVRRAHSLIDPQVPISPSASGVHRITNAMVEHEPTLQEWFEIVLDNPFAGQEVVMVAHNARFDHPLVKPHLGDSVTICTLKLARLAFPDAPDHKLATLKYMFNLGTEGAASHGALADVEDCADLLRLCANKLQMSLYDMIALCNKPQLLSVMPFGKHKGIPFSKVPKSYLAWLRKQDNIDEDVKYTLSQMA
jgi:DNA polymerase III epsilon subunit-like protein